MRSGIVYVILVAALILISMPRADRAIAEASRFADGVDLIVVCGDADDNAPEELQATIVIRSCWLDGLIAFGVRTLQGTLKLTVGVLVALLT
jgi:hypothetical protein